MQKSPTLVSPPWRYCLFIYAALLLLVSAHVFGEIPKLTGPVVDEMGLLQASEKSRIEQLLLTIDKSRIAQMAVLITPNLGDKDIETYGMEVAESWKLGKAGKDQGLILIIAPKNRRMRLEVGYGLEGEITDAFSKHVLSDVIAPYFQKGRFADGIMMGIEVVANKLNIDLTAPVERRIKQGQRSKGPWWIKFLPIVLFFLFPWLWFFFFAGVAGRRQGWGYHSGSHWGGGGGFGGGGFGGGGFGGGGGGFGGGGASGSW